MKTRQTKALENALARAILTSNETGKGNPVDRALLLLLAEGDNHMSYILGKLLKSWELHQIKGRIEKEIDNSQLKTRKKETDREFIEELRGALTEVCGEFTTAENPLLNSAHLLLYITRDRQFAAGRVLAMYNITPELVKQEAEGLPADEDYYTEMNTLRNIHILHINPNQTAQGQNSAEENEDQDTDDQDDADNQAYLPGPSVKQAARKRASTLEKYGTDLTRAARGGEIDPVIGRQREIERLIQILGRRKKNNPILIGDAGVGKSAIVEGLALKIASRDVPPSLYGKTVFSLDITSMVAGTKYRGQFEERIKAFMDELRKDSNIILFIDEIHTIVGAGSTQGSLDTANILKPALARGELQCIGATTMDEFRQNIENDSALERRFQKIIVEPTSKDETLRILTHVKEHYEKHHSVSYSDEAIAACVDLTDRYVTDRNFPDKAIDVLDEAGSRARLAGSREPDILRELEEGLGRAKEEKRRAAAALKYDEAAKARMREVAFANRIGEVRADMQRARGLNPTLITGDHIREVVSAMTGIPVQNVSRSEKNRLKDMYSHLDGVVIGQQAAISKVTRSIQRSRAGLKDPGKPIGVFMFVGPTGVGKTLLAKELSLWMFGRKDAIIRLDMSEYSEKHNVSRLIGSPPGYVGYNEGGQLTEAVRRQPYAVVLFDEIEKAHPEVFNVMLQLFDEGQLTDGSGRRVDFRNTVIIMTSNAGSRRAAERPPAIGYSSPGQDAIEQAAAGDTYRESLERMFAPEFLNRIDDIVVFNSMSHRDVKLIVDLELKHLFARAEESGYKLSATSSAREKLASLGYDPRYGVRSLKRVILEYIEEPLAHLIVNEDISPGDSVTIGLSAGSITLKSKRKKDNPKVLLEADTKKVC